MILWGSIVNALTIVLGTLLGTVVVLRESVQKTVMQVLGLGVLIIGIDMGLATENILLPLVSLVVGGIVGEYLQIESRLSRAGELLAKGLGREGGGLEQGFLTATLIYCTGAMAILGALESGLQQTHQILYAKSLLDGVLSVFLAAALGIGVAFSALAVLLYQGSIALLAELVSPLMNPAALGEITAAGGIMLIGIGFNLLGLTTIAVGNLAPALVIVAVLAQYF